MHARNLLHRFITNRPHLSIAIGLGTAIAFALPGNWEPVRRALVGWNVTIYSYLLSMAWVILRADHNKVKAIAGRQDENAGMVLLGLLLATVLSITAIVVELHQLTGAAGRELVFRIVFTALTILGSWFFLGTLFCIHYAHLYYQAPSQQRPLNFAGVQQEPNYWDFLYFSFTIAVAAQTSDVSINTRPMRKLVLAQSVLSFFFNMVILGLCVNLGAALINGG